jgi:hypothetical protein
VGHFRNQSLNDRKEVNTAADDLEDEALICSMKRSVDSRVMDSGSSFHATIMKH